MSEVSFPGVPKEIQRKAGDYANELWPTLEHRFGETVEIQTIKPVIIEALMMAYMRAVLDIMKAGIEELGKAVERLRADKLN